MTHTLKAAALRYAAHGWPVFLLGRSKRPVANCAHCASVNGKAPHDPQGCRCLTCHGFYAATRDQRTITRMLAAVPSGMLAIRTGAASGLVVVDVDPDHGGRDSIAHLVARGLVPPTRFVATGSGGLHLYYRHPGQHAKVPNSAGKLGPGIDIRGDGGYVVAPPSIHPDTRNPYVWADEQAAIEEMAPALADACQSAPPQDFPSIPPPARCETAKSSPARHGGAGAITHPDRLLAALLAKVRDAPPGRRRVTLYGCARGVARIVATGAINAAEGQAALLEVGLAVGQTPRSARAAIVGGFADEGVTT